MAENFLLISQAAVIGSFIWNIVQTYEFVMGKLNQKASPFNETLALLIEQMYVKVDRQSQELADIKLTLARKKRKTRRASASSVLGTARVRRPSIIAIMEQ